MSNTNYIDGVVYNPNSTFMKAPNGKDTNLNERQWLQVRTEAFKNWFGDWEKQNRIDKLRNSKDIEITGEEHKGKYELNSKSAQQWILNNLRGKYTIADTNETVELTSTGAKEVTSHNRYDEIHLKSIAAIPEMLKNAVFIEERNNRKANDKFDKYRYYVVGLKIGGVDYTAKLIVGVKDGKQYYDHRLTEIEKKSLIDITQSNSNGFTTTGASPLPSYSVGKDNTLISILQNNSSKVVDSNGEPMVVYHGSNNQFTVFDRTKSRVGNQVFYFSKNREVADNFSEKLQYGGQVVEMFLNIRNPYNFNGYSRYDTPKGEVPAAFVDREDLEKLKSQKYDGGYYGGSSYVNFINEEYVAFAPSQIKSSTDNNGNFDEESDDVRFMFENLEDSSENNNFAKQKEKETKQNVIKNETENSKAGMDNGQTVGNSSFDRLVGRPEARRGIYQTVEASNNAGIIDTVREIEEREELESRGINPDWDKTIFRRELEKQAEQNGALLDKSYLDDKTLIHDQNKTGTSENDVYKNPDGKTLTKVNNLSYVKGSEHIHNLSALIDRLAAHNALFPNVAYDVKGFIKNKQGFISLVMEQPEIDVERNATKEEIDKYLIDNGFKLDGVREWSNGHEVWSNGKYELFDARPANVLKGKDGMLYFIDTFPHSISYMNQQQGEDTTVQDSGTETPDDSGTDTHDDNDGIRFMAAGGARNPARERFRDKLDKKLRRHQARRKLIDNFHPVKLFLDVLRQAGVKIAEYNDWYLTATHQVGKSQAEFEEFKEKIMKPLNVVVGKLKETLSEFAEFANLSDKELLRAVENYVILKHGLERNTTMTAEAIAKQEKEKEKEKEKGKEKGKEKEKEKLKLKEDYSGIYAVAAELYAAKNGISIKSQADLEDVMNDASFKAERDKVIADYIAKVEGMFGDQLTDDLWQKVNAATEFSLKKQLNSGLIDRKTYNELTGKWKYYVPLRGHDQVTAEDFYDYGNDMGTFYEGLKVAKGRRSRSETPFAFIPQMAQTAIITGNKNSHNLSLKRIAALDTTGLISASQAWYDVSPGEALDPFMNMSDRDFETLTANPQLYRDAIDRFEADMQAKKKAGFVTQDRHRLELSGMFIKKSQAKQHTVKVYENGKAYNIYINANPLVSRAINGDDMVRVDNETLKKIYGFFMDAQKFRAQMLTTKNPRFMLSNMARDFIFASTILPVKEDFKYFMQFQRNWLPGRAAGAMRRWLFGELDLSKQDDLYVYEFVMNGAMTGFSSITSLKNVQREVEAAIKSGNKENAAKRVWDFIGDCNELIENNTRLAVYMTSRQQGRSIARSVNDAKNVTLNFNQRGTHSGLFAPLWLFSNAGIQAANVIYEQAKLHPIKMSVWAGVNIAAGGLIWTLWNSLAATWSGDGDDDDEYLKLSEWDRQNNICIRIPYTNGFLKIPNGHENRVFYALGDNFYQGFMGKKDWDDVFIDNLLALTDLVPINPIGGVNQGGPAQLAPDMGKPFVEVWANKTFSGRAIYDEMSERFGKNADKPAWTSARKNKRGEYYTPQWFIDMFSGLSNMTGGDERQAGFINLNPDKVYHITNSYLGGLFNIAAKSIDAIDKAFDGSKDVKTRDIPIVSTFWSDIADSGVTAGGLEKRYREATQEIETQKAKISEDFKDVKAGSMSLAEFAEKIQTYDLARRGFIDTDTLSTITRHKETVPPDALKGEKGHKKNEPSGFRAYDAPKYSVKGEREPDRIFNDRLSGKRIGTHQQRQERYGLTGRMKRIKDITDNLKELSPEEQKTAEREIARLKEEVVNMWRE
ncbi:MAG: hypothetical protein LBS54_03825 [Dysgonamonadaceae bacterium]|nr:hypothetical protein [Dysgonamonadaceae bacterium]